MESLVQFGSLKFGYNCKASQVRNFDIHMGLRCAQEILSSGCATNKGSELFRQQKSMQNYLLCKFFKGKFELGTVECQDYVHKKTHKTNQVRPYRANKHHLLS